MQSEVYQRVSEFKRKYPMTIAWRLKKHCKIIEKHLNEGEIIKFAFAAQKNNNPLDIVTTYAVVLTNKRILLATDRLAYGYFFTAITPDMFNDLKVVEGLIWGRVIIDTAKEVVYLSNLDKKSLPLIETEITEYMMHEKKKYAVNKK